MFTDCQATLQQVQNTCETVAQQHQNSLNQHQTSMKAVLDALQSTQQLKDATIHTLKTLRAQLQTRNRRIHRLVRHYEENYQRLQEERKKPVSLRLRPNQAELDDLEMKLGSVLRFDSLLQRKRKMEEDMVRVTDEKKEQIKKTKLNISLAELELKDLQQGSRRSSRP